ncbi:protein kinase domain-containing protein [Brevifollis gellanilyticus]|nr:protein kinase [Brevifollis gellanilyticus]
MNSSNCPECGATIKPGATLCPACLLSAGTATLPVQPVSAGITTLPCVFGGYRLLKKLGTGGMGIVYEAEELAGGRRLALKVLNQSLDNEEQRQRFLREGRLAATIDHPHSVYVFGTEEIEGVPVIAMELAEGGTLRDEFKRRGPLPVRDAVDAILGVLDGLEAAHAKGILHRDMKPSNCFVTSDGKTIVGDYGLSISQNQPAGDGSHLTRSGMIMGTPAFSPPEQLRGQPLDQRADIYSTAGTLYYLLTGKAPVEATSPVETVAAVLEGRITPLAKLRLDVPADLAAVVMRCLSADAAKRPASHAEMRQALMPFSSITPEPAPLRLRLFAGILDGVLIVLLTYLADKILSLPGSEASADTGWISLGWYSLISLAVGVLFFAGLESRFGTTPGKALLGLVVRTAAGGRPDFLRAACRASLYLLASLLPGMLFEGLTPEDVYGADEETTAHMIILISWMVGLMIISNGQLLLFIRALRHREKLAWHDKLTGLRVWRRGDAGTRPLAAANILPAPVERANAMWGPFHPGTILTESMRCGFDPVLRRPVLLERSEGDGPSVARRDCQRGGRLRWLQSVTDAAGNLWDVWQAPAGALLSAVLAKETPSWQQLLFWLKDLGAEHDAAEKDGTLPLVLSSSQVWITTSGRAVLLDRAWPGAADDGFRTAEPQAFLHHLTSCSPATSRPLHADAFISGLQGGSIERPSHVCGNLAYLRQRRSTVSQVVRAAVVLAPMLMCLLLMALILVAYPEVQREAWTEAYPDQPALPDVIQLLDQPGTDETLRTSIRQHVAGHYSSLIQDGELSGVPQDFRFARPMRTVLADILKTEPVPSAELLAQADDKVRAGLASLPKAGALAHVWVNDALIRKTVAVISLLGAAMTALFQLLAIIISGSPLLMGLSGIVVVSARERPAGRLRMIWRWLIGWTLLCAPALVMGMCVGLTGHNPIRTLQETCLIWVPAMVILILSALLLPRRSLMDRVAGTWLVAR